MTRPAITHPVPRTLRALLVGLSLLALATTAQAQTNVWTGLGVGDWDDAANWSLGVVPQAQFIPPDPGDVSVLIDTNPGQDSSVLMQGQGTRSIGSLRIDAGDTLTIADEASLVVGPVLNSGAILLTQGQGQTASLRSVSTLVNAPGAILSLDNGVYVPFNSFNNNVLFWNQSLTEGYGTIRNLTIQNDDLIDANVTGEQLALQGKSPGTSSNVFRTLRNPGTLRASGGGTLRLSDWQSGGILNQDNGVSGTAYPAPSKPKATRPSSLKTRP